MVFHVVVKVESARRPITVLSWAMNVYFTGSKATSSSETNVLSKSRPDSVVAARDVGHVTESR